MATSAAANEPGPSDSEPMPTFFTVGAAGSTRTTNPADDVVGLSTLVSITSLRPLTGSKPGFRSVSDPSRLLRLLVTTGARPGDNSAALKTSSDGWKGRTKRPASSSSVELVDLPPAALDISASSRSISLHAP